MLVALVADALIAWMPVGARLLAAPSLGFTALVGWIDGRLNRPNRSDGARRMRGAVVAVAVIAAAAVVGAVLARVVGQEAPSRLVEAAVVLMCLGGRRAFDDARRIAQALRTRGNDAARSALAGAVGYETREFDEHAVARSAIELVALRFSDALVVPAFWYLVAGLPGFLACRAASLLADRLAPHQGPAPAFGKASRIAQQILEFVPAPLAGLALALAALFSPAANPWRALRTMLSDSWNHVPRGGGWPIAATAGALGLALAGPKRYGATAVQAPWVGQGRARARAADIQRTTYLVVASSVLVATAVGVLALAMVG
jgi:adenosylcobinamide-phosphate synthase